MRIGLLWFLGSTLAFQSPQPQGYSSSILFASNDSQPRRSRIEGNQRLPTEQEIAIMDEMIDKLAQAKPYELPAAVQRAFRVISSPQFFLRIAARQDEANDEQEKERLAALASNLVSTLDAVVSTTEDRLDERAKQVQRVVQAAAEPNSGEFLVPLVPERIQSMRQTLEQMEPNDLDESFLMTLDAWMNKAHQDGMDLMVSILQKVLQLYAGNVLLRNSNRPEDDLMSALLQMDPEEWQTALQTHRDQLPQLKLNVQKTMETVVLSLDAGSMAQRVQAEYLKELVQRIEALE